VKSLATFAVHTTAFAAATFVFFSPYSRAQDASLTAASSAPADASSAVRDLQDQVRELRAMMEEMRAENAQSRSEMQKLRLDLQATRALLEHPGPAGAEASGQVVASAAPTPSISPAMASGDASAATPQTAPALEDRVQKLEDTAALLGSKIDEQYETKVESASKYRARLHGIVLMNAFHTVGNPDNLDLPTFAQPVQAGFQPASSGATLRQSEIGLEIFGPHLAGAKTSADVQLDFAGGFPNIGNGVSFGIVRLQTANVRFDWEHTSIVAGQDSLFISPLAPTSFASLSIPTFAFAGNLWGWTPQLRVEHRFSLSNEQTVTVQAGILDNLDWEFPQQAPQPTPSSPQNPPPNSPQNPFLRVPQAGEMSGQPAYAVRTAWSRPVNGHRLSLGAAGFYGRQAWTWSRYTDSWAGMLDWEIPLPGRFALSGEFYRGRGIGGLGGAAGQSVVFGGSGMQSDSGAPVRGLDAAGGWAQLKFRLTPKVELNGVISDDNAYAGDVRGFALDGNSNFASIIGRNQGALANVIFRPRSDLLLAAELRRLRTFPVYSSSSFANQVNLSVGILF
jgi:hypothetical protein